MDPQDVAIADDGSVLVADTKPTTVKVFDSSGAFQRAIGRDGAGPGEFRDAFIAVRGDTLVVQDAVNSRATTFDWRTGEMLSERRTACCYFAPIDIDGAGRAVVRSTAGPPDSTWKGVQAFVRFSLNSQQVDTVFVSVARELPDRAWLVRTGNHVRFASIVPWQARAFHEVDSQGGFLTGASSEYLLQRTTTGFDTLALFGRDWTPKPVSAEERTQIVERRVAEVMQGPGSDIPEANIRAGFDPSYIPDSKPAYEAFAVDAAGRTWVRRVSEPGEPASFDLFDISGRWLDVVTVDAWPSAAWKPVAWGRTAVAVPLEGEDGRPLVRVYRIQNR